MSDVSRNKFPIIRRPRNPNVAPREVDALNRRVYAELFLTPDTDPWLGLAPANTFSALENGGLVQSGAMRPALRAD